MLVAMYVYKAVFTLQRFWWIRWLVFHQRGAAFTRSFVVLSAEVNYACGMWACRFGKHVHSKFSTMRCRKRNFVLMDVEVGLLLTFLASMKAKLRLYQKYVSVFGCLHVKRYRFSSIRLHLGLRFHIDYSLYNLWFSLCVFIVLV